MFCFPAGCQPGETASVASSGTVPTFASMNTVTDEPAPCAWEEARRQGVDMEMLEANLRMTPDERIMEHRRALRLAEMLSPERTGDE